MSKSVVLSVQICLLLVTVEGIWPILCNDLYVTTSTNTEPCPAQLCATLSQIATNHSVYLQPSANITLVFQQGYHFLDSEFVLRDVRELLIILDNSAAENHTADLLVKSTRFYNIGHLRISNLKFTWSGSIIIESVENFTLDNSTFVQSNETALRLFNTTASIVRSFFILNSLGTYKHPVFDLLGYKIVGAMVGGAVIVSRSNVTFLSSSFVGNSADFGGAVFGDKHSQISVLKSNFSGNVANTGGGALYTIGRCNVTIVASIFQNNTATRVRGFGGAVASIGGSVVVNHSNFTYNVVGGLGGRGGAISVALRTLLKINSGKFTFNVAEGDNNGGVICIQTSTVIINGSKFESTSSTVIWGQDSVINISSSDFNDNVGGVMRTMRVKIYARDSHFMRNSANDSWYGGVMWLSSTNASITNCIFTKNTAYKGGVFELGSSHLNLTRSKFYGNHAFWGGVLRALTGSFVITKDHNVVENNSGYQGIVHFQKSTGMFLGTTEFINNKGSFIAHDSSVTFKTNTLFFGGSQLKTDEVILYQQGGAITGFQSSIFMDGTFIIRNNSAENGGAIYTTQSKVNVLGEVMITDNVASDNGGGIYLYQSELNCLGQSHLMLKGNTADQKGGGVHVISSLITVNFNSSVKHYTGSSVQFIENSAMLGGGICLVLNSYFHILRDDTRFLSYSNKPLYVVHFTRNLAKFGGAVYIADDTNPATCASVSFRTHSPTTECFLQTLALLGKSTVKLLNIKFTQNRAKVSGHSLFGGLFDRCTVSPFSETYEEHIFHQEYIELAGLPDGVAYLSLVSNVKIYEEISSEPIQLHFCRNGEPDSSYQGPNITVNPGEDFSISVAALDQVNHTVMATVRSSLFSNASGLGEGQLVQGIAEACTNITFTIFSSLKREELVMYAEGPCKDANKSQLQLPVQLSACKCPIGFQIKRSVTKRVTCECECDSTLYPHITQCNSQTGTLTRKSNVWITYVSASDASGYVLHPYCPFDYCYPASLSVEIDLRIPGGADAQCEFNRSGMLCGTCKPGLSLSISSPQCLLCLKYWPAVCVVLILVALLLGVALVALILILNLTVAIGTINGIVFYANIVYANNNIYFPRAQPKLISTFVAWLNLDLGIDACFFEGMNAYWKTWLQLAFPAYIVFLVAAVIAVSQLSSKFSKFIGKMNPVATLATLILLSYVKFLYVIISALSFTVLRYPNGSREVVWLPDATVQYFVGKHSALFITAVVVLTVCTAYTILIFSWQWLLRLQNKCYCRWLLNQKLGLFIESYHIPYNPHHRYWTGLLLLTRIAVQLTSAANVSGNPSINLLTTGIAVSFVLFVKGYFGHIYRNWLLGSLEVVCYLNIVLLSFVTFFVRTNEGNQIAAAYISGLITIALTVIVLCYHIFTQLISKTKLWRRAKDGLVQPLSADEGMGGNMELTSTQSLLTSTIVDAPRCPKSDYSQFREELLD